MSEIRNPQSEIRKIGIIGEGKMGTGIFNYLLDFNYELVWVCSQEADTEKIIRQFLKRIKRSFDTGIIDQVRFDLLTKTSITGNLAELHDCDLIIEAIPENPELKKSLFEHLDRVVKPEAVFASNSSSVNPSEMFPASRRSERFTGLHFFYPVSLKNIVELTVTMSTSEETTARIKLFLNEIKRRYLVLDEKNSFILNKIFLDVQNEAFLLFRSGQCTFSQVDELVKNNLFPFGVFDFCDSVGLDTMLSSIVNYTRDYPDRDHYSAFISTLTDMVSAGKLGVKSQEGFYSYPLQEVSPGEPENQNEIMEHLRETFFSSARRLIKQANIPAEDANHAIREYFDIDEVQGVNNPSDD
jgi:3-hydroxybutyryl-CoA dehydrogenase